MYKRQEEMLGEAIGEAEEWAGRGMGLEVEPRDLKCNKRREYERKEFMDKICLLYTSSPPVCSLRSVISWAGRSCPLSRI